MLHQSTTLPPPPPTAEPTIVLTTCQLEKRRHRLNIAYTEREVQLEDMYLSDGYVDAISVVPPACK